MSRSLILLLGLASLGGLLGAACRSADESPAGPHNLVLLSIDTLRADRLNSYGYGARTVSPHIDRLAEDGILFEAHITASPWTTPAHLSLFTGLSPSAHGVTGRISEGWNRLMKGREFERLSGEQVTLAEVLQEQGYTTAAFTGGITMDPRLGFSQGFDTYDTSQAKLSDDRLRAVTRWIEERGDEPFFLFWHTFEVHAPYLETDFLADVLPPEKATRLAADLALQGDEPGRSLRVQVGRKTLIRHRAFNRKVCSALYDGGILSADRAVGEMVAALQETGRYDDTLIVVTSDHGEQLGETTGPHGLGNRNGAFYDTHGSTLYEEMIRVPLILKLPGSQAAGRRVAAPSRTIDVMPTVLDVVGVDKPGAVDIQGSSLRSLWEGGEVEARQAFTEAINGPSESKSLRDARHKYVVSFDGSVVKERGRAGVPETPDVVELYDLTADPGEQRNLVAEPSPGSEDVATTFDKALRLVADARRGQAERVHLGADMMEQLEALGYVEEASEDTPDHTKERADGP